MSCAPSSGLRGSIYRGPWDGSKGAMTLIRQSSNVIYFFFRSITMRLSKAQSIPYNVGNSLLSSMISITSKSAKLCSPSMSIGIFDSLPNGYTLTWFANHSLMGELCILGLPISSQVSLVRTFTLDPRSKATWFISYSLINAFSLISLPVLRYFWICFIDLLGVAHDVDKSHWLITFWSSTIACSSFINFKQFCKKVCKTSVCSLSIVIVSPWNSPSLRIISVGSPLLHRGSVDVDVSLVQNSLRACMRAFFSFWTSKTSFFAFGHHTNTSLDCIGLFSCGPLVDKPLRIMMLSFRSGLLCSTLISCMFGFCTLFSCILANNTGHSSIVCSNDWQYLHVVVGFVQSLV